jgi:hypothetical protein
MQTNKKSQTANSSHNATFWFHVIITALAWVGPFLFSWYLMVTAYMIVLLQFLIFNRCLLNAKHDLDVSEDTTFYSYLFEKLGYYPNRSVLKKWVRRYVYLILSGFTIIWQLVLGFNPLLF